MIDNYGLWKRKEAKCLSRPHIEDVEGVPIYDGDKYVRIGKDIYSWETLEKISEYWEEK